MKETDEKPKAEVKAITKEQLDRILEQVSKIRYGSVTLIIQDGVLVQIDSTEKLRLR